MGSRRQGNPYVPHTERDLRAMMEVLGIKDPMELFSDVPREFIIEDDLEFEGPLTELEVVELLDEMGRKNLCASDVQINLGQGIYPRYVPAVVSEIISRSEFFTSYTPYQPELSQGVLWALFEYQSLIAELVDLDVVTASLYDWSTAVGEAGRLLIRYTGRHKILVGDYVFSERVGTLINYIEPVGGKVEVVSYDDEGNLDLDDLNSKLDDDVAGIYFESPNGLGFLTMNVEEVVEAVHRRGGLVAMGFEPTSLGVLEPPGALGVDVAVAEGQSLGLSMSFGGPCLGILACRHEQRLVRSLPGRLIGMGEDLEGNRAFTMVLQTREQHIRREKATSNICTNQTLMAIGAAVYLSLLGRSGLRSLAEYLFALTEMAIERFSEVPRVEVPFGHLSHYQEFTYRVAGKDLREVLRHLLKRGIVGGCDSSRVSSALRDHIVTCFTEVHGVRGVDRYVRALGEL
ncbi:MAG: aminomethyl-transferring glycine dehydrogenase subunit GcvPA [Aigarchaeota archaeon]|nr:aminomethyl-transferring glycine dehydrogenase subunit GcvPA [Aigarchaeota archaeon]MDW8092408.1 aminomethyl-transferring glycine dehydrogenase subunit GcvPA [Nitrososphaerota archaeon]